jgi:hypothetical protein
MDGSEAASFGLTESNLLRRFRYVGSELGMVRPAPRTGVTGKSALGKKSEGADFGWQMLMKNRIKVCILV